MQTLINTGAPTEVVLAYQINNEQFFLSDVPPLSLTEGMVETGNGLTYDMSSDDDKRSCRLGVAPCTTRESTTIFSNATSISSGEQGRSYLL